MSESSLTYVTEAMRTARGQWSETRSAPPISETDIRRWAMATFYPEQPPRIYRDAEYATTTRWGGIVAPPDFNPFAWPLEQSSPGPRPRFVVTSIATEAMDEQALYEKLYCARGDMENRIKEQQLDLFADRTSTATMHANQLRLYFASFAYVLMQTLRRVGLAGTRLAKAQCGTIRDQLLKVGVRVRVSVRRIKLSFSESWPRAALFRQILYNLQAMPLRC